MNKQQNTQQPVAWLSIDGIGERYLCFSEPIDNDEKLALYTAPPVTDELPVRYYKDGGITYAVYGSSSINYVEKLRAMLSASQKGE